MGQENLLQLQAEGGGVTPKNKGEVYKEEKSDADIGTDHSYIYRISEENAGIAAQGQNPALNLINH